MAIKDKLMDAMAERIKRARVDLAIGWHNPDIMEEIAQLNTAIKLIVNFEKKLLSELDDID